MGDEVWPRQKLGDRKQREGKDKFIYFEICLEMTLYQGGSGTITIFFFFPFWKFIFLAPLNQNPVCYVLFYVLLYTIMSFL